MSAGVNKAIIVGRLGSDPEVKYTASGKAVARFNVATNEAWTNKDGQKEEKTEWHRIVVWGKQAENCAQYLSKGREVYIEGRLQTNSWEDKEGNKRYTTEIVAQTVQFLGGRQSENIAVKSQETENVATVAAKEDNEKEAEINLNDVPF